jgi:uncharacterized membrane protein YcaP (DUF421 family)
VQYGEPIEANLRRERLTQEELMSQARLQGIEHIGQIKWAVLERTGNISFIQKPGGS